MVETSLDAVQAPEAERWGSWERIPEDLILQGVVAHADILSDHETAEDAAHEIVEMLIDEVSDYETIRALEAHRERAVALIVEHTAGAFL